LPVCVGPSYKTISSFLIGFYKALGIEAAFACEAVRDEILGRRSSLCFDSKEKYDMVANGRKMGGSAQKRSRDLIFQHGSIPIDFGRKDVSYFLRSKDRRVDGGGAACLEEMLGKDVDGFVLSRALIDAFARSFNADFEVGGLTGDEEELFSGLKRYKYETDEWNIYRVDKFSGKTFAAAGMDQ
jgi:lipoate-protein ligase A